MKQQTLLMGSANVVCIQLFDLNLFHIHNLDNKCQYSNNASNLSVYAKENMPAQSISKCIPDKGTNA